jgi:hypothetical protein
MLRAWSVGAIGWDGERMYAITLELHPSGGPEPDPADLRRRIESAAAATAANQIQHVYIQGSPDCVYAVLFLIAPDLDTAERTAAGLYEAACAEGLTGFRLVSCQMRLILPFVEPLVATDP